MSYDRKARVAERATTLVEDVVTVIEASGQMTGRELAIELGESISVALAAARLADELEVVNQHEHSMAMVRLAQ